MRRRAFTLAIAGMLFILLGVYLISIAPSVEIGWVIAILLATVFLFSFEIVPIDVAAVSVMVFLGLTTLIAPIMGLHAGLVDIKDLFNGFAGNAVMSIIAVMIIGAGLDKAGLMNTVARIMTKIGGTTETRIIPLISGTVGIISGFMQNVGAAALFLPVVRRIGMRANIPVSRLLMPMGFCAILGGTLTLVGSSPLILLNDLIANSNKQLAYDEQLSPFDLFSVTPIGLAMIAAGIAYFVIFGRLVLPKGEIKSETSGGFQYFKDTYGLDYALHEIYVPKGSPLIGKRLYEFEEKYRVETVVVTSGKKMRMGTNGLLIDMKIEEGDIVGWIGEVDAIDRFVDEFGLEKHDELTVLADTLSPTYAGMAEMIVPPTSPLIGDIPLDHKMRSRHGIPVLAIIRNDKIIREGRGVRTTRFEAGDTIVTFADWSSLYEFHQVKNFAVVTTEYPHEETRGEKSLHALIFLAIALSLVLFTDLRLSVALLVGAIGMIVSQVLTAEEAYYAVSWKTVFLLASLIPLGGAVESTGTAAWIAEQILAVVGQTEPWVLQLTIAVLATVFTLVMSNVGATILLVPLAVNIALNSGGDPRVFALTVALATSNSFLIPTHQVNALIMGPGGYSVADYMRVGGIMTILFLAVLMVMMNLFY